MALWSDISKAPYDFMPARRSNLALFLYVLYEVDIVLVKFPASSDMSWGHACAARGSSLGSSSSTYHEVALKRALERIVSWDILA